MKAGKPLAFTSSPKAIAPFSRDNAGSKMKTGLKASPKQQASPILRDTATALSKAGHYNDSRNQQPMAMASNSSMGASRSSGMNVNRANTSPGMAPAPIKQRLQKAPVPLLGGKVLDDNDDEEEDYEDEEFDEQSPTTTSTAYAQRRLAE